MAKEILLYSYLYDFTVAEIIKEIEAAKGQDIKLRINTGGGDVLDSYGLVAKLKELENEPELMVDGKASSMGAFLLCYFKNVSALDISEMTFHRAAFPSYIESNPQYFTPEAQASLKKTNDDLRAAMEGKVRANDWQRVTGTTIDDLFSTSQRIDVTINAAQALELGLIQNVVKITPEKKAEIEGNVFAIAAMSAGIEKPEIKEANNSQQIKIAMTIEKLKAEHPDVYAAAINEGVLQERDRCGAFLTFVDVDAEAVATGIKSGASMTATQMAELTRKSFNNQAIAAIKEDAPKDVPTDEGKPEVTAEAAKLDAFKAEVLSQFNKN